MFRVYKVTISKADLKATQDFIKKTTETFHKAFKEEKPRLLPLCRPFKCGPKGCQYWEQCKPEGRYPLKTRTAWPEEKERKAKEREETNGE